MNDIARLFQAFLAPAIFISATALLILSINVRLMGIVSRLRQFVHAKYDATKSERLQEAGAYTAQIASIEKRAEIVRRSLLLALIALAGTISSCLLLGLGLYVKNAALTAVVVFVAAMICLLPSTLSTTSAKSWPRSVPFGMRRGTYASWIWAPHPKSDIAVRCEEFATRLLRLSNGGTPVNHVPGLDT